MSQVLLSSLHIHTSQLKKCTDLLAYRTVSAELDNISVDDRPPEVSLGVLHGVHGSQMASQADVSGQHDRLSQFVGYHHIGLSVALAGYYVPEQDAIDQLECHPPI